MTMPNGGDGGRLTPGMLANAIRPDSPFLVLERSFALRFGPNHPFRYQAYALPDVRGLRVVISEPEILRGYTFDLLIEGLGGGGEIAALPAEVAGALSHGMAARMAATLEVQAPITYNLLANPPFPLTPPPTPPPTPFDFNVIQTRVLDDLRRLETQVERVETQAEHLRFETYRMTPLEVNERNAMAVNTAPVVVRRTLEQEDRFAALVIIAGQRTFSAVEQGEYTVLRGLPAYVHPTGARTKVKVRVVKGRGRYDSSDSWTVMIKVLEPGREWRSINVPPFKAIKSMLPPESLSFFPTGNGRDRHINYEIRALDNGINPQLLADVFKAWAMLKYSQPTEGTADSTIDESTAILLKASPATLEVGGKVYKLIPTGEVDVRPLMQRVRSRALAGVGIEAEGIRNRASQDARIVISQAESRSLAIREEIESQRRALGNPIPEWVKRSKRTHYWDGNYWNIELNVVCRVKDIRMTIANWGDQGSAGVILHWNPLSPKSEEYYGIHKMPVWVKLGIDGAFNLRSVYMREWRVVHISNYCCMGLQGLPSKLDGMESVYRLEEALSRGMEVVNLNSPLYTTLGGMWPDFEAQLPEVVKKYFTGAGNFNSMSIEIHQTYYPEMTWDRIETVSREVDTTFSLDDARLVPTPRVDIDLAIEGGDDNA